MVFNFKIDFASSIFRWNVLWLLHNQLNRLMQFFWCYLPLFQFSAIYHRSTKSISRYLAKYFKERYKIPKLNFGSGNDTIIAGNFEREKKNSERIQASRERIRRVLRFHGQLYRFLRRFVLPLYFCFNVFLSTETKSSNAPFEIDCLTIGRETQIATATKYDEKKSR